MSEVVHDCGGYVYWDDAREDLACTECPDRIAMEDCSCDDEDVEIAIVNINDWKLGPPSRPPTRDGRWQVDLWGRPVAGGYPCYVFDEERLALLREYVDVPSGRWSR
ncbi:hypothetical protein I7X12_07785 [Halosimplex litoreum]|uniref:Uncharacterized protein n=1 Tax=Halosimplex litoreum TaxID=1198301 RepID=A0A7T3G1A3_9EURY|nr:hypothetical protein [Halosimplex litoreum]QPV64501.1 hypothetical protein I7X12_07785 [Halosimplex litoreum]